MSLALKRFSIAFSILLPMANRSYACWWGTSYEDVRYLIFNPNIVNNDAWRNFYYTTHLYYLQDHSSEKDERALTKEWKKKLGLSASEEDIYTYLFKLDKENKETYTDLKAEFDKNKPWGEFVDFAKKCESSISTDDPWQGIHTDSLESSREELAKQGITLLNKQTDPFWKKKYAFQVLRLAYYNANLELFNQMYTGYFDFRNYKSPLDMWAANYKSMTLEYNGEKDSANFIHAMVFSNSSNKMLVSHQWYRTRNFETQLSMAANVQEESNLYMIRALKKYDNAIEDILKVYELNPSHPLLPLALTREMNKIEDVYGTYQISSGWEDEGGFLNNSDSSYLRLNKVLYIHRFYEEVKKMEKIKRSYPNFYHLLLTNLAIMNRDITVAKNSLAQVSEKDSADIFQKKVLGIILNVVTTDITTDASQNFIGNELGYLIKIKSKQFESQRMLHSLFRYLQRAFEQKNQPYKAKLLSYIAREKLCSSGEWSSSNYAVIKELDEMGTDKEVIQIIRLFNDPEKNKLEEIMLSPYPHEYYFWELLGTIYLRQNNLEKSVEAFKKIPKDVWAFTFDVQENLALNPFTLSFLNKYDVQYMYWDKGEIVDSLYKLEFKKGKTSKDYRLLANAWFNFSKFGNSWYMLDYYRSGDFNFGDDWYKPSDLRWRINKLALMNSINYYKKGLQTSKNEEEKTEMIYMIAFCYYMLDDRNNYIPWARQYEQMENTVFYRIESCDITPMYDDNKYLDKFFTK